MESFYINCRTYAFPLKVPLSPDKGGVFAGAFLIGGLGDLGGL